ncbi:hypothetical protein SCATT_05450 [Streptantibioticus cattleyicolor NRRL 8057 = DSM 46488]|uniref:Uncharacterized protein n=1 Tax=Streptantibioticus cattleyicolor (strain ATCC 35852 / DSM 46488 / JCM 4925 / NBRC 14057 / NRRL 8057) TaxID=1003195 RepID=F8JS05_STREN|nr:hypothetical protein SCATT_05450 [Streptantibioticus cattleyicolor NRRL 8057 = DSM 46488]MYS57665.1 hypothetical protein [Streptomyces sp. SID5468]CCB73274.1 protein of unknown function [Streptantibioticus cattleyicolor NRRL 8057 = DSM 46488]
MKHDEYHWVVTLMWVQGDQTLLRGRQGIITVQRPGTTRQDLFHEVLEYTRTTVGAPESAGVIFWSLKRNRL